MPPAEQTLELVRNRLNEKEQAAYRHWQHSHKPEIAPATATRMFTLFLNGTSCEQIHQLNPGFSLPQIVRARIVGEWDRQRDEYLRDLLDLTRIRTMQTTLETTDLVADLLSVAKVEFGEKLKRYMLTRNAADLGDLHINGLRDLKEAVLLFQALTGQDKQQKVSGEVIHTHRPAPAADATPQISAADALKLLGTSK